MLAGLALLLLAATLPNRTVLCDSNGNLLWPTNFFSDATNGVDFAAAVNAVSTVGGGGISAANATNAARTVVTWSNSLYLPIGGTAVAASSGWPTTWDWTAAVTGKPDFATNTYAGVSNALGFVAATNGAAIGAAQLPALSGDITTSAGSAATSLKATGTAGTYRSVTFDAQGRETGGTSPTTFAGYGVSDSAANLLAALTDRNFFGATNEVATNLNSAGVTAGYVLTATSSNNPAWEPSQGGGTTGALTNNSAQGMINLQGPVNVTNGVYQGTTTLAYTGYTNVLVDFSTGTRFKLLISTNTWLIPTNIGTVLDSDFVLKTFMASPGVFTVGLGTNALGQRFTLPGGVAFTATTNVGAADLYTMMADYTGTNTMIVLAPNFK